jgi:uncharacterized protein (TIGR00661 family)
MKHQSAILLVQGEGRGHMTQAIAAATILRKNGIQITMVLVGMMAERSLPDFFLQAFEEPVEKLISPGFSTKNGRGIHLWKTIWHTARHLPNYIRSVRRIHTSVSTYKPTMIISFYEPLFALYNLFYAPAIRKIAVAHQYEYLHEDYVKPDFSRFAFAILKGYTRFTGYGADVLLALSLHPMAASKQKHLHVIPPLLRAELFETIPSVQPFLLVYIVNPGYIRDIERWHARHPDIALHCFTDDRTVSERENGICKVDETLIFHALDGRKFLNYLAACSGVCCTAGFETVAEAVWLNKPILLVPVEGHLEQRCNAWQAERQGIALWSDSFDPAKLTDLVNLPPKVETPIAAWIESAEMRFVSHIS